jgi:hypothetical protein
MNNFAKGVVCALISGYIIFMISISGILPEVHISFSVFFGLLSIGFFIKAGVDYFVKITGKD